MFIKFASTFAPLALAISAPTAVLPQALAAEPSNTSFSPAAAFISLDGQWQGQLTYRDYGTNKLETIPVAVSMEALPDGETMVQRYNYTDPSFQVYITDLISVREGLLIGTTARAGRAIETYEKTITVTATINATDWKAVLSNETQDDNRPARVREVMVRKGTSLTMLKEVDYLDDDKEDWVFRNKIALISR